MSKGLLFGSAVPQAFRLDPGEARYIPGLLDVLTEHSDIWVFDNDFQPAAIQPTQGSFNLAPAQAAIARAQAAGIAWRLHLLVYPVHDMPWINSTTLTSSTYKSIIDAHLTAVASIPGVQSAFNIDVTNEIFDGNNTLPGGYRPNQWYTASAPGTVPSSAPGPGVFDGPDWVAYTFLKARQLWPNTPLYFCHDQTEQITSIYHVNHNANILNFLTKALAAGIPIDGFNMQGHLGLIRGFDAPKLKAFMSAIKSLGLKIMIGELDCRTGNDTFANYTTYEYDRRCSELIRRFLDVALPFLEPGDPILSWGMSDIRNPWTVGERPLPLDVFYQPKQQYAAIRDSLKKAI
ncbi:endo-1,4-beta-xylanase [Rhizobium sp. RU36D]|uniref:endo-1,4-beta-xylanase n=1 Tax=Rhizobium sp. RU36D TaxID=1907415 RepID=UPI0009D88187|nr:endo-1,4-beta-xylanase [Rhizobium sp. RU36D]SMD15695.1 Endo-1,4-beta-xylanase, GH35 family [Rhizobium sp. RU36D]